MRARVGLTGSSHATSYLLGVLAGHAVARLVTPNTPPDSRSHGMPPSRRLPACAAGWTPHRWRQVERERSVCPGASSAGGLLLVALPTSIRDGLV